MCGLVCVCVCIESALLIIWMCRLTWKMNRNFRHSWNMQINMAQQTVDQMGTVPIWVWDWFRYLRLFYSLYLKKNLQGYWMFSNLDYLVNDKIFLIFLKEINISFSSSQELQKDRTLKLSYYQSQTIIYLFSNVNPIQLHILFSRKMLLFFKWGEILSPFPCLVPFLLQQAYNVLKTAEVPVPEFIQWQLWGFQNLYSDS